MNETAKKAIEKFVVNPAYLDYIYKAFDKILVVLSLSGDVDINNDEQVDECDKYFFLCNAAVMITSMTAVIATKNNSDEEMIAYFKEFVDRMQEHFDKLGYDSKFAFEFKRRADAFKFKNLSDPEGNPFGETPRLDE